MWRNKGKRSLLAGSDFVLGALSSVKVALLGRRRTMPARLAGLGVFLLLVGSLMMWQGVIALAATYNSPADVTTTGNNQLNWTGQGVPVDQQCAANEEPSGVANTPYLLWIFTFSTATLNGKPELHLGGTGSGTFTGDQFGHEYHIVTPFFATTGLTAYVTFDATALGENGSHMNLTISHGCNGAPEKIMPDVTTAVLNVATNEPVTGDEIAGVSVYDTAKVTHSGTATATGTVTYAFFSTLNCTGTSSSAGVKNLSGGNVPNSDTKGPLQAGSYSFMAHYSGDDNFDAKDSGCEPFTIKPANEKILPDVTTSVLNVATNEPVTGDEIAGVSVYDTAKVTHSGTATATGTVTYTFFSTLNCTGTSSSAGVKNLSGGNVPNSDTKGPLQAGSYSFMAHYSGDDNFDAKDSGCEPFTVKTTTGKIVPDVTTNVLNVATNGPLTGNEIAGVSVYDTAKVTHAGTDTATGTVTYTFFSTANCTGASSSAGVKTLSGGNVPNSDTKGPLQAGSYSFKAHYSGDNNFAEADSACEPFTLTASSGGAPTVSSPTPTPTGGILAETGANPPGLGFGFGLMLLGFVAMVAGALSWRRQRA